MSKPDGGPAFPAASAFSAGEVLERLIKWRWTYADAMLAVKDK